MLKILQVLLNEVYKYFNHFDEDKNRRQGLTGLYEWAQRVYVYRPKESRAHPLCGTPDEIRAQ